MRLHMVRKDTGVSSEGTTSYRMAVDEAVGSTLAFLTMWWTSLRLVSRGRPEHGLHSAVPQPFSLVSPKSPVTFRSVSLKHMGGSLFLTHTFFVRKEQRSVPDTLHIDFNHLWLIRNKSLSVRRSSGRCTS
ncbi:hypothetical protein TNCV_3991 [Trichonephila clavipes]|nr:hypothetical protein TNCV_3991 [Trichonephila clavipes]